METNQPLIMAEEYWMNTQLSIAKYHGGINFRGAEYLIVNKDGLDLWECSLIADKEGREKAIEPGEPADLCRKDLIPAYRKLGRDRIIELIKEGKDAEQIKEIAGVNKKRRSKKKGE